VIYESFMIYATDTQETQSSKHDCERPSTLFFINSKFNFLTKWTSSRSLKPTQPPIVSRLATWLQNIYANSGNCITSWAPQRLRSSSSVPGLPHWPLINYWVALRPKIMGVEIVGNPRVSKGVQPEVVFCPYCQTHADIFF